ncbi:PepSY-associated TM helix domain-containing protein [Thalassotalea psychrophila]|uniref:PepSY-associated TM helix domain-containing protein n=1 Tax=Thalassotalea psychrophila TaxID=3065647 RepID=A0ABY9TUX8_9GAMM|nr:PepSY-associated TM helix domain-containing protein [Colwelliaceae bacterium SQ149]
MIFYTSEKRKPKSLVNTARKYHKWLMLFCGVQFVIWSVSGAYMVFFDIDYIHGDSLVVNHQDKINVDNIHYSVKELREQYPDATNVSVGKFIDKEVYSFTSKDERHLVDASNGKLLSPLKQATAINAAKYYYSGEGHVLDVELITENPPFELSRRALPAWRINFDDFGSPSIYVSAQTGKLVGKRHEFWRLFDWMFRFHVMDYDDGENIENLLLFCFALFGIIAAISGLILTYFRVFKANGKRKITRSVKLEGRS